MTSDGEVFFELLPIEINEPKLKSLFASQLKKGINLSQIIPVIEKDSIERVKKNVSELLIKKNVSRILKNDIPFIESEYLKAKRTINEVLKWLEYLIESRKQVHSISLLPENESEAVHRLQMELNGLLGKLEPSLKIILKKREEEGKHFRRLYKETVDHMEEETRKRTKKIVLKYEKMGKEKYALVQKTFDQFFKNLHSHSAKIFDFIQPKLSEWNELVLRSGRGFYINRPSHLPCSILFSVRGQCYLIFENVGHWLGSGADKLVIRCLSLPEGKIQALIRPTLIGESAEDESNPQMEQIKKQRQFHDMWLETEMLMRLREKRGIIDLHERMAFQIGEEKMVFLVEDYYWDGSLMDYLKFPIHNKVESSKLSAKTQKRVLADMLYGLVEIHKNGIIHHDLKPDNILLDFKKKRSKAVIADFQLAGYMNDKERLGRLRFRPTWAPPEYAKIQLEGHPSPARYIEVTSDKTDVWSLGLIFYCLIAYELPTWVVEWDKIKEPTEEDHLALFRLLAELKEDWLPSHLKTSPYFPLLEKMLKVDPQERCTAAEALQMLKKIGV